MARYRKAWENKNTGWNFRLDIVPYGSGAESSLSGTITPLNSATVTIPKDGFDVLERGFDDLPIGLCMDSTLKISMIYDNLPSALQTYLNTKESGGERNLFLLFSDRGTAGATYTLEGAFVQAGIGGKKYKYEEGATIIEIELMDAAYWVLTDTTAEAVYGAGDEDTASPEYFRKVYEVGFPTVARSDAYHDLGRVDTRCRTASWGFVMERLSDIMCFEYTDKAARTQNATAAAQTEAFDYLNSFHEGLFNCITLKTAADNAVRTASAALTKDTLHVITHVWDNRNVHVGGMYASEDERGWARYESVRDLLQDLAESCNGKLYYNHEYVTDAVDGDYLRLNWYWVPIGGDRTTDTAAATLDMGKALEAPETDEMEVKIGKAEVRFDTNSSDDVKETVINTGASRGSRSYNTRCIMTNAPVVKDTDETNSGDDPGGIFTAAFEDAISIGFFQTNQYVTVSGATCTKVHEYTKVYDTFATGTEYNSTHFQTVPSHTNSEQMSAAYNLWVKEAQSVGCLHYALADSLSRLFGHNDLASITLTFRHSDYPNDIQSDCLGRVHILTGALATATPHLAWARAVVTNVKINYTEGTSELTYLLVKI